MGQEQATREEHLQWCKDRALEYLPHDPAQAVASMGSDLSKHPGTEASANPHLIVLGLLEVSRGSDAVRRWIHGFN